MFDTYVLNKQNKFQRTQKDIKKDKQHNSLVLKNYCGNPQVSQLAVEENVYEGGYLIWECTFDMLHFLHNEQIPFKKKKVLELGCGHGLIGLYVMKQDGQVVFQEFNREVINNSLLHNVKTNLKMRKNIPILPNAKNYLKFRFKNKTSYIVKESWEKLNETLAKKNLNSFDYILGSEILYREKHYDTIIDIIKTNLKKDGKAYIASKFYYFGMDDASGSAFFLNYVNELNNCPLYAKIIKNYTDRSVYTRNIIEIGFKGETE